MILELEEFNKRIQHPELFPHFVFAYPTEAVYGLGCNPFDETAVERILHIKKRPSHQRFILIAHDWEQIWPFIRPVAHIHLVPVETSWPGPVTWVFPASDKAPSWLVDTTHNTIALRITAHPVASELCRLAGTALISTSANLSSHPPCRTYEETERMFGESVDGIIPGMVDMSAAPTPIRDVLTGKFFRK